MAQRRIFQEPMAVLGLTAATARSGIVGGGTTGSSAAAATTHN
jgi:hypothetical protein